MKKKFIMFILLSFLVIFLLFPLVVLLLEGINLGTLNLTYIEKLKESLKNSILIGIIVTIISVVISYIVTFLIVKNHLKRKNLILTILTLTILVPTFTHAIGFISFWGNNGLINNIFNTNINMYGFWGIVLCSICYGIPLALIMFVDLLASENHTPYQVAKTLGIPKFQQFIKIKLAFIIKPTIFIMFTVFTMSITDYGIPMMIGGHTSTLTTMLYEQIVGRLNFGGGALISIILLLPAVVMFTFGLITKNYGKSEYRLEKDSSSSKLSKRIAILIYIFVFLLISFPMISCIFISFTEKFPLNLSFSLVHIKKVIQGGFLKYLLNSLIISFFASLFGVIISFVISYIATRIARIKMTKTLHLFAIFTSSVPGLVLAVAYMLTFNKSMIYGTIIILIIVNIVRYMGTPYLIFTNKLDSIDKTIERTGSTLGIPQKNIIFDVIIPQNLSAIIEGFSYIFVNTMASVTTVLFLSTPFNKPIALAILQLEANNLIEMAAFISLIILITNIFIKTLIFLFTKNRVSIN